VVPDDAPLSARMVAKEFEVHAKVRREACFRERSMPFGVRPVAGRLGIPRSTAAYAIGWLVDNGVITVVAKKQWNPPPLKPTPLYKPCPPLPPRG